MPEIRFNDQAIKCETGDNLRRVLMKAGSPLYNGVASLIHCRGLGTCGTCAVQIQGEVSEMTRVEKWRLNFPPHQLEDGLRLACQCEVLGDLKLEKLEGMWGNRASQTWWLFSQTNQNFVAAKQTGCPRRIVACEFR